MEDTPCFGENRHTIKNGGSFVMDFAPSVYICLDGNAVITGENYRKEIKSLKIKITDKELLKRTGGIIQGMSGSPIIQDNKIIGAVTHVLLSDSKKGYGIYLEFMFEDMGITVKK